MSLSRNWKRESSMLSSREWGVFGSLSRLFYLPRSLRIQDNLLTLRPLGWETRFAVMFALRCLWGMTFLFSVGSISCAGMGIYKSELKREFGLFLIILIFLTSHGMRRVSL